MEEAIELRSKYKHFRVLVMGRANAGKTTVLQAVCGSTEAPEVYDRQGRRIRPKESVLSPTSRRGLHNIDNELRFPGNRGFVFHDSRGFEAGATEELEKVRAFIDGRAAERSVDRQLHAIWFCIPTDNDARMLTTAELDFFERCDTGKVPVIAIFTKFDSLDSMAFQELRAEGASFLEAQERAPRRADEYFERVHLSRILQQKYRPVNELRVRNMHEFERSGELIKHTVAELLKKTSDALDTDALKLLLATVQNNNINICMENVINSGVITTTAQRILESGVFPQGKLLEEYVWKIATQYPYIWSWKTHPDQPISQMEFLWHKLMSIVFKTRLVRKLESFRPIRTPQTTLEHMIGLVHFRDGSLAQFIEDFMAQVVAFLPKLNQDLPLPLWALNLGACAAICFGAFCCQDTVMMSADNFQRLWERYEESGTGAQVRAAIREGFDEIGPYDTKEQKARLLQIVLGNKDLGGESSTPE